MTGHPGFPSLVTVIILAGLGDHAEGAETASARIVVELSDHAGSAAETLTQAKRQVARIYGDIGVEVLWTDATPRQRTPMAISSSISSFERNRRGRA